MLLEVTAVAPVEKVDLFVRDDAARAVLLHTGWADATKGGTRDLTMAPFRIGLTVGASGPYSVGVVGAIGATSNTKPYLDPAGRLFYVAEKTNVSGDATIRVKLLEVPRGDDVDQDLFPSAAAWPGHEMAAATIPPQLLDCNDLDDQLFPFAKEQCGNAVDDDCDGLDEPCDDRDRDGDPDATDCAPDDPKIHHPNALDRAPESANCCGYAIGKMGPERHTAFDADPACKKGSCGDGIDQDCDGVDKACRKDGDCDEFAAGAPAMGCNNPADMPPGTDCNDCDVAVNPLAPEVCGDGKDNNCNGAVDETCVTCDLDGDGFQRADAKTGCPDAMYQASMKPVDCNDEDAGVFPGSTMVPVSVPLLNKATCGGMEGGGVACAMRGACRNRNPAGTRQDADCDGAAAKGCPMANDADGDGFASGTDCNDQDPETFPGAPDHCGDGKAQNCVQDGTCGTDGDKDGWDDTTDCNDNDPAAHPWAAERCNGVDDDCDGLVDEGNPDATGQPMVANGEVLHCTDSGLGECAKGRGDCVCSAASLKSLSFDQASRMACPGETEEIDTGAMAGATAPRCYFAAQPRPDVCDALDNDCSGATPDGKDECPGPRPALVCCAGACVDLLTSSDHCDGCGKKCPAPVNAAGSCVNGMCGIGGCLPGFADCDKMMMNGCEIQTASDASNCGVCGKKCANPANATAGCANGMCGVGTCNAGFNDCDKLGTTGCESKSIDDAKNCGMCGTACSPANGVGKCAMSMCAIMSCNDPFKDCNMTVFDGCETNVATDAANCNNCGMKCPTPANGTAGCSNKSCGVGSCTPPFANCDNMANNGCEVNTLTSAAHCGGCGKSCAMVGGDTCTAGLCLCGILPLCDVAHRQCKAGACLLKDGEPCTLNSQCFNNDCNSGCKCCK